MRQSRCLLTCKSSLHSSARRNDRLTLARPQNSVIHALLAARALYIGLGIQNFVRWLSWLFVPAECPHCQKALRPAPTAMVPWFGPRLGPSPPPRTWTIPSFPALPAVSVSTSWTTPTWLKAREGYAPLINRVEDRYADDPEGAPGPSS
jgi:hypothetical protein